MVGGSVWVLQWRRCNDGFSGRRLYAMAMMWGKKWGNSVVRVKIYYEFKKWGNGGVNMWGNKKHLQ